MEEIEKKNKFNKRFKKKTIQKMKIKLKKTKRITN